MLALRAFSRRETARRIDERRARRGPGSSAARRLGAAPDPVTRLGADSGSKDREVAAGICDIPFGSLGVHKFVLGYIKEGVIMAMYVIGLIEGIIYLTKSDYDFVMIYGVRHKGWF